MKLFLINRRLLRYDETMGPSVPSEEQREFEQNIIKNDRKNLPRENKLRDRSP